MLKRIAVWSALVALTLVATSGCRQIAPLGEPLPPAVGDALPQGPDQYQFAEERGFGVELGAPPRFTPQVPPYEIAADLSNVANLRLFRESLRPTHLRMLAQQGFVVVPADWQQMEFVYEQNNYDEEHLPSFITVDSILHTFHIFYDYLLRTVEATTLYDKLVEFAHGLAEAAAQQYHDAELPEIQEASLRNYAYALVPVRLLGEEPLGTVPPEVAELVEEELALIAEAQDMEASGPSPTVGFKVDYSQFIPRGHYTRSEKLERFFMAMMWYGLVPVALRNLREELAPEQARQAALLAQALLYEQAGQVPLGQLWEEIYEPTAFMVGFADDNTPGDFGRALYKLFGEPVDPADLLPEGNLAELADLLVQLREPRIKLASVGWLTPEMGGEPDPQKAGFPQLRTMGQRFVLDSYLMQMMVFPHVGVGQEAPMASPGTFQRRTFPMGLDVMSLLGSDRAYQIAAEVYEQTRFRNYAEQTQALRAEVAALGEEDWTANLYNGWLHTLRLLLQPKREGYPSFMHSEAWLDKQINAALASWAELRHDTILYAKQSVVAQAGGGWADEPPLPPRGYVEPEVLTYWRLGLLATQLRDGLLERGLLEDESLADSLDDLISLLEFLQQVSIKQLTGQALTAAEFERIEYYGDELAGLNLYITRAEATDEITSMADHDMAVVADVHTGVIGNASLALTEGVGHAHEVYAIYPIEDELLIGRGAVFSYYEFTVPVAERMTDEQWQEKLGSPDPPQSPLWTRSFLSAQTRYLDRIEFQPVPAYTTGGG